jgi:hypothetical protein
VKRPGFLALLVLIVPLVLACGITNTVTDAVTGGDTFKPAAQLWSDVPPMPGLAPSDLEDVPLPVKLLMRTVIANLGQDPTDQTQRGIDWISYDFDGAPTDVGNFYTTELMTANGWETDSTSSCGGGSATGVSASGTFCAFQKTEGGMQKMLAIIATQEDASKPTSVFFLRLETAATQ